MMRYWPIIAGAIALAGTWTTFAMQLKGIIEKDEYRLEQIRTLEDAKIQQAIKNREIETRHKEQDKYIRLLDSKYEKRCK